MAIDNPKTVDVVSIDRLTGEVILDITDHLDWSDEKGHITMLQDKINAYASFIESGELEAAYPAAQGHSPLIHVACMNQPTSGAIDFFSLVRSTLDAAGIRFSYRHAHFNSPPHTV